MSDHIDRQNWVTQQWLEWRQSLDHTPTATDQIAFCHLSGIYYDTYIK